METTKAALMTILMLTVALAGCMGDDTSELDARISELEPVSYTHLTLPTMLMV